MAEPAIELHEGEDADRLFAAVYAQLKRMAHRRLLDVPRAGLDTTELVHELYLRIGTDSDLKFAGQGPFFAYAARAMRHLLLDRARDCLRLRAGGDWARVTLDGEDSRLAVESAEQAVAIDDAFNRLAEADARGFATLSANQHYLRQMNRRFKFNDAGTHLTAACLLRALVLFADVDSLNNHPIFFGQNAHHSATFALVYSADDFNGIT